MTQATDDATTALLPPARSLEEALPGSLVFLNHRGNVIPPRRARLQQAVAYSSRAVMGTLVVGFCVSLFGWAGALFSSAYLVFGFWNLREGLRASRAWRLMASDPAQAESLLESLTRGRWRASWVRARAHAGLAQAAILRGDAAAALEHYRAAALYHDKSDQRGGAHARIARHGQVFALVNLGRVAEARAVLSALGPVPSGDYLRIQRWTCELYVCFAEGAHAIEPDELHQRSRAALRLSAGGMLVALCAWAHAQYGDHDQAAHLLAEVGERANPDQLAAFCPRLDHWMTAYARAHAGADGARP